MVSRKASDVSDETRVSAYYGTFFLSIGAVMPFVAIWMQSLGLSSTMTGFILAAPQLAIVTFNIVVGSWADRLSDWRTAIVICNGFVLVLTLMLFGWQTPLGILLIWTLSGLFMIASAPITDAAALDMTSRRGSDFARIRSLGSVGFVVGILIAGWVFDSHGMQWFLWVLLTGAVLRVLAAILLPHFKERTRAPSQSTETSSSVKLVNAESNSEKPQKKQWLQGLMAGMELFKQPGIFLVILGAALLNASHSFQNMYSVLHWAEQGISTTWASWLWTIGVIAEVGLMWSFKSLAKRVSARHCLLFSCITCAVRWFFTGLNPSLGALVFLQALHGITFGLTFLASVNFIARRVNPNHAAQAQSVLNTLTTLLMAIGIWLSGIFYSSLGGYSYWAMAVLALLGGGLILSSYRTALEDTNESVFS